MKSKGLQKFLTNFLLPFIVFIALFLFFKPYISLTLLIIYIAYRVYSGRAGVFSALGNLSFMRGNSSKAVEWFANAHRTGKAAPRTSITYAYLILREGNIEESEKILIRILNSKLNADDIMYVKSNLALVLWRKGDLDGAIDMLEDLFKAYKTTTIYGSLGYFHILKGDMDKALEFNLEAYDYNNSNAVILDNLGQTYYLIQEYDKAQEIYEKLMPLNPVTPGIYYNYGLVLEAKGQPDKALEYLDKALTHKISYLSAITREEIETKINQLRGNKE